MLKKKKSRNRLIDRLIQKTALIGEHKTIIKITPQWTIKAFRTIKKKNMSREFEFPENLRRQLLDMYREDILKTQELIKRDLSHWLIT